MPVYEYECSLCHFRFEQRQSFDQEPTSTCPRCQGKARRILNSIPIIFKGSGFYVTDNRQEGETQKDREKPKDAEEGQ